MIDEKDWEILDVVQRDGRATYGEIGQQVGLAASSVHERVRKLESRGIIKGFGPRLDPERMGYGLRAFITVVYSTACSHFADRIADWPEIEECHGVAGDECVILKVRTADTHSLSDLLERLRSIPGVERTRTSIILKTYIDNTVIRRPTPANGARASSA